MDWKSSHIEQINNIMLGFLWGSIDGKHAFPLIRWDIITQPKEAGGLGIINIAFHIHARRPTFIKHVFDKNFPWTWILWKMIQYIKVVHHGEWTLSVWDMLFSHAPLKLKGRTAACIVQSWEK